MAFFIYSIYIGSMWKFPEETNETMVILHFKSRTAFVKEENVGLSVEVPTNLTTGKVRGLSQESHEGKERGVASKEKQIDGKHD